MTRTERSRLRRRRKRIIDLSLLGCMIFFLTGIGITYDTMRKTLGLPNTGSLLSFRSMGQALQDVAKDMPALSPARIVDHVCMFAEKVLGKILDVLWTIVKS